jgi:hypothetical protein
VTEVVQSQNVPQKQKNDTIHTELDKRGKYGGGSKQTLMVIMFKICSNQHNIKEM